ncbi:MAG: A/G-specific adenine glycosylase [Patescibacteria group bacterium]
MEISRINQFIRTVKKFYKENKRDMPWRTDTNPYYVVVSELMLQQTQVHRVTSKFNSWIKRFPNWQTLATASTKDVLQEWSGLGYNRRALFLKRIAEQITDSGKTKGVLPKTVEELTLLPGIGPNTAGSILAFAFNIPYPFIETNIRSVYIHHFFAEIEKAEGKKACKKISDTEILPLIEQTLKNMSVAQNPREWYWALMDYGSFLKKSLPNPSRQSAHHVKQSKFEGSNRELRSKILKLIMKQNMTSETLVKQFKKWPREQVEKNVEALTKEGFIVKRKTIIKLFDII